MKKKYLLSSLFLLFVFIKNNNAQDRFKVAAVAGINLSQVDGDNFSGYDKFGVGGGLRASTILTERIRLDFEMLYSQRGTYTGKFKGFGNSPHFFNVDLDYAEIPITGTYLWKEIETKKKRKSRRKKHFYYRYALHLGLSVGRMIHMEIDEKLNTNGIPPEIAAKIIPFESIRDKIIRNDLSGFFGLSTYFSKNIGLTVRHSTSLTPLYSPNDNENIGAILRNYYITSVLFYEF